jgi:hypothetical protein
MRQVPAVELELMLAASFMSERSENFQRLVADAGLNNQATARAKAHVMTGLRI